MEKIEGVTLRHIMEKEDRATEKDTVKIISQLISIVCYLNNVKLAHCDIRPNNILINPTNLNLKIIDFGSSNYIFGENLTKQEIKEKMYAAPEELKGDFNKECDMWSIGVIAFELLSGNLPFKRSNKKKLRSDILNMKININKQDWGYRSIEVKEFIERCLQPNPKFRMTPAEGLNHKWIRNQTKFELDDFHIDLLASI
jgi:calcium-dependent protein kinase